MKLPMTLRLITMAFIIVLTASFRSQPDLVVYPQPPGLRTSADFSIKANGIPVWVEKIGSKIPKFDYSLYGSRDMEDLNAAGFSCSGEVNLIITASENINNFLIRPKSRNIVATSSGRELRLRITGPQKLYIEINNLPHLAIFADPPEDNPPAKGATGVLYYGPGNYNPGEINLKSNQTLYIAGGAVLNANIRGTNLHNVKISGRGILQGNIEISGTTNLEVTGIFIRNTVGWTNTLTNCHNAVYHNIKIFSYEAIYSVDGIDVVSCVNFKIDDCFMRCRDDCVAIKSGNPELHVDSVLVTNCVMVGWACSDGVTLGFELNGGPVENVYVKNCDILYARGGGRTNGHAGFSIVCDGPAWVKNIKFEDLRIEKNVEFKNLELIVTDGTLYGNDPPGHIKGVTLKNIVWEDPVKPFIISGFSKDNLVEDVIFENCKAGGKILTEASDGDFRINSYTRAIKFQ